MAVATKFAEPLGPDDNLSVSIGESAFLIDDYANESVRELLSPTSRAAKLSSANYDVAICRTATRNLRLPTSGATCIMQLAMEFAVNRPRADDSYILARRTPSWPIFGSLWAQSSAPAPVIS
jgi:hypothetical protein